MAGLTNPNSDGSQFKAKFVNSLVKRSINSPVEVHNTSINKWMLSDEVVIILRKWKLDHIDDQNAYDGLQQLLGSDRRLFAVSVKDLASFAAAKHVLRSDLFDRDAQGRTGEDKARFSFVATVRDLIFDTDISSVIKARKSGDDAANMKSKMMYEFAAYLLLDVLLDLQGDKSYWTAPLGGSIVDGWTTKSGNEEDQDQHEELGEEREEDGDKENIDVQSPHSLTTEDWIRGKNGSAWEEANKVNPAKNINGTTRSLRRKTPLGPFNDTSPKKRARRAKALSEDQLSKIAIRELSQKLEKMRAEKDEQQWRIWELEAEVVNHNKAVASLKARAEKYQESITNLQAQAEEDKEKIKKLEARLAARRTTI